MISAIFSRINENWTSRLFALVICWFIFAFTCMMVQGYKRSIVREELKKIIIPNGCYLILPNNDHSIIVAEKGINKAGIRDIEKQLVKSGYRRVSDNRYETNGFIVVKEYDDEIGNTHLVIKRKP